MKLSIVFLAVLLTNINCDDNPVDNKPYNRSPVILSLTVFPDSIGPEDSAIVICNAFDPDGDTLVYDWITDGKSRLKGAPDFLDWSLYHTFKNSNIIYPKNLNNVPIDTLWVQCFARDRKGKSANSIVYLILKK